MLEVLTAYDEKLITELQYMSPRKIENTLTVARKLADSPSVRIPAPERIQILERTMKYVERNYEKIVKDAAMEGGKPLIDTRAEITRAINGIKVAIEELGNMRGSEIPMGLNAASLNRMAFTFKEPIGVVVAICAFNHPFNLAVHQVIPAVAVGCPVIIKPATTTPLSTINLLNALYESGLPEEWAQLALTDNKLAEKLATDPRVDYLTFIGSGKVGWYLRSKLSPGTRCALEHGGSAPVIVEPDADLNDMLPLLAKGGFYHAGQVCVSVQRVFAHSSVSKKVVNGLKKLALKMKVGDPMEENTEIGPLILPRENNRVHSWVKEAVRKGGKLICGGKKINRTCYEPTIILNPPQNTKLSKAEIFGPVIAVYTYNKREEAISKANSLPLSFQASIFTKNIDTVLDTVKNINAASVIINDHTAFRVDWMPFRGAKESGIGIGGIPYTMHEMTQDKLMVIRSSEI
ncbi:MAG: aldehyde dehydrogenase family protein [Candidatus Dadabacteria bacterium]|nr:aldehyde dehydrogenase family protein [Candidatus Dadabacteria bacterium]NIQ16286.1 aldehyde dehydrogenase family protein [Candidatus Dadabacteria bacterium]